MKKIIGLSLVLALFASCSNQDKTVTNEQSMEMKQDSATTEVAAYTPEMVVNKKDYSCGMPVTAGISDTCHVDGKAYGFCSSECKAEFLKDPKKYITENKE
jgi:YHS domain-containing protein